MISKGNCVDSIYPKTCNLGTFVSFPKHETLRLQTFRNMLCSTCLSGEKTLLSKFVHQKKTQNRCLFMAAQSYCWWFRNPKQPPGMVLKPVVNNGINYQPQLVNAGFLPSTVSSRDFCHCPRDSPWMGPQTPSVTRCKCCYWPRRMPDGRPRRLWEQPWRCQSRVVFLVSNPFGMAKLGQSLVAQFSGVFNVTY